MRLATLGDDNKIRQNRTRIVLLAIATTLSSAPIFAGNLDPRQANLQIAQGHDTLAQHAEAGRNQAVKNADAARKAQNPNGAETPIEGTTSTGQKQKLTAEQWDEEAKAFEATRLKETEAAKAAREKANGMTDNPVNPSSNPQTNSGQGQPQFNVQNADAYNQIRANQGGMMSEAQMRQFQPTLSTADGKTLQYQGVVDGAHTWGTGPTPSADQAGSLSYVDLDGAPNTAGSFHPAPSVLGPNRFADAGTASAAAIAQRMNPFTVSGTGDSGPQIFQVLPQIPSGARNAGPPPSPPTTTSGPVARVSVPPITPGQH